MVEKSSGRSWYISACVTSTSMTHGSSQRMSAPNATSRASELHHNPCTFRALPADKKRFEIYLPIALQSAETHELNALSEKASIVRYGTTAHQPHLPAASNKCL